MGRISGKALVVGLLLAAVMMLAGCGGKSVKSQEEKQTQAPPKSETSAVKGGEAVKETTKAAPSIDSKKGGTLTIAFEKEISTMNPQIDTKSVDRYVRYLMYESLVGTDQNQDIKPALAERWNISTDGKEYTFFLRKGAKFHNGKPMTAKDVKWTVDYVMDSNNGAYGRPFFDKVASVAVLDDYTIKFVLETPAANFLSRLASIQAMAVVPEGSLETGVAKTATYPPGTGPFKYQEYKPGQHLAITRFDDYWGQVPYLDRVILKMPIPDENVRFAALRAGDLDAIQRTPYQWVKKIIDGEIKGIKYAESSLGQFRRIVFNVKKPPFNDVKVRQAVAYGIDKQEILDVGYWGFGYTVNEKMVKGSTWHLGVPDQYAKAQPEKARQLLKEAGYPDGIEITLMDRQGQEAIGQTIQQQLAKAGIKVKLDIVESATYTQRQRNGDFQFINYGGSTDGDPSTTMTPDLMTEKSEKRGSNVAGYSDPEMDRLLTEMAVSLDFNQRKELYRKVMEKVWTELPELYIGAAPTIWAYKDTIKDFSVDPQDVLIYVGGGLNYAWLDK